MNRNETEQFCLRAAQWFLLTSFFAPFVLVGAFFFPYIVPKTIFFQLAIECALFFYCLLIVLDKKKYAPRWDTLTKAVVGFFAVWVAAAALGADPLRSFFGTYERMLSVVNLAHFIALYLIARAVFRNKKDWLFAFRTFVAASVVVSLYGIGQQLGLSGLYHAGIDRIDSTIGNAAFLAAYLIFAVFFAMLLFIEDTRRGWRIWYAASIALNIVVIYLTVTRGAALGLIVGALCLGCAYLFKPKSVPGVSGKGRLLWWGAGLVALVVALIVALEVHGGGIAPSLERFTSLSFSDETAQTRLFSYTTSWQGFLARPVLGWGPENYNLIFDKFYNPRLYPTEEWFDHAHNIVFDMLTQAGALGFLAYVFLIGWLGLLIVKRARQMPEQYWQRIILLSLLVSYVVQNIFVFDSLETYLAFFLLCAYTGSGFLLGKDNEGGGLTNQKETANNPVPKVAALLLLVFVLIGYWASVRPALGSYATAQALHADPSDPITTRSLFERALALSAFGKDEVRGKLADFSGQVLADSADVNSQKVFAAYTIDEMQKSIKERSADYRNYLYFAAYALGNYEKLNSLGISVLQTADAELTQAEPLAPDKPSLWVQWGKAKFIEGQFSDAVSKFARARELAPGQANIDFQLALSYHAAGKDDKALSVYDDIAQEKNLVANDYIYLAIGFWDSGDTNKAVQAANTAAELDPSLKDQADKFISDIQKSAPAQ